MVMAGEEDAAVVEYARYLGIEPHEDASLMYIAREAVVAQLPPDWEEHTDDDGNTFYFNEKEDRSMWEHPCDAHYRGLVLQVRQAVQPSKQEAAGAQDVPLEVSASPSASGLEARLPVKPALLQEPSTDVKNTVNAGDKLYLDAISSPEARCWWAENIGRKRVRTRHVTKLLAAWLMGHDTSNAKTLNTATSNIADDVVTNSSTTREYARIVVNAMATEEGKVSVDDFGSFVANSLQGDFSPTALRSLARKLQSRRTVGAKRRQQTSPDGTSVEQGTNIRAIPSVRSIGADMRAFEVSRDSRASAVLERQRASPTAAKYKVAAVSGVENPNGAAATPAMMTSSPASAFHRELLAPLTSSPNSSSPAVATTRATGSPLDRLGEAVNTVSGSPVRLPSLEHSPVAMKLDSLNDSCMESLAGGSESVNKPNAATDQSTATVGIVANHSSGSGDGPTLIGQGGHQRGGDLVGSRGIAARRWPARHKFSMKRMRQRSEKLQPVENSVGRSNALPAARVAAEQDPSAGIKGIEGVKSSIDTPAYSDGAVGGGIDQAW